MVNGVGFMISEEDLAVGPDTRLNHSRVLYSRVLLKWKGTEKVSKEKVSFNFMAAVTICSDFGGPPPQIKSLTVSIVSWSICHEVIGPDAMILVFWMLSFKPNFSLSSFTFIKRRCLMKVKNWCFWTAVLEKALESPLDCKDIKTVNHKGN